MPEKQSPKKAAPIASFQCGATVAQVIECRSNAGFRYLAFRIERLFSATSTAKQTRSSVFFASNAQEIAEAALKASNWINARQQADAQAKDQIDTQQEGDQKASEE